MKKGWLFFASILILFSSHKVVGQCAENLSQAQEAFDNGHLYGIPALLQDCIEKGSTSDQDKIEAYRLLTLTYLYIDDPIAAKNSFLALLKLDPEYRVDSTNQIEIVHLSKEYITTPIVSARVRGGANMATISVIHENGSYNLDQSNEKYTSSIGFSAIGSFDVHFSKWVSFSIESDVSYNTFKYTNTVFNSNGEQNTKDLIEIQEKSWNVGLPVSIKLTYPGKVYYPYIYGGYSPNYNIVTTADATYTIREKVGGTETETINSDNNLDISNIRQDISHSFIVGGGVMRRIKYNYIFVDVRYKIGIKNRVVRDAQFDLENDKDVNTYTLNHTMEDNFFKQNELSITVGYVWPKYKPRKRKSVTATSFIGGLFKKKKKDE